MQVPSGHNPTGIVMSEERKRALYRVCQRHDLVIIEDDAYYWLQFYQQQQGRQQGRGQRGGAAPQGEGQGQQEGAVSLQQQGQQEVIAPRQKLQPLQREEAQQATLATSAPTSDASEPASASSAPSSLGMDGVPGLNLPASFLSIDTDGRVVRVDTLSKLMGPG